MFNRKRNKIVALENAVDRKIADIRLLEIDIEQLNANMKSEQAVSESLRQQLKKQKSLKKLQKEIDESLETLQRDVNQAMTCKALEIVRNGANGKTAGEFSSLQIQKQQSEEYYRQLNVIRSLGYVSALSGNVVRGTVAGPDEFGNVTR